MWGREWIVVEIGGKRHLPGFEFLKGESSAVRVQLIAIVDSVRQMGPDQWKDTTSHAPMHGELAHLHEARDKHGQTLYRLFLYWQRQHQRVAILDGRTKANNTTLSDADYEAILKLSKLAEK